MEIRYYLIYGPVTLAGVTARQFVGYIRVTETQALKNVSVVKTTIQQVSGAWQTVWNVPEIHYQYPLMITFDTVVHDALQRAYEAEGADSYSPEHYPYL